jgi:tetratricopeptide (TPR) repeat protein
VAERVGATHVVTGTVVQQGDSVRVTASLWQGREEVTQARVTAGREEASALAEQVGLLAAAAGQFERLSGLMPSSTEAVQFWLEGQRAYRDGRFRRAVELQGDALEVDSTFALAAWGMMKSAQWLENTGGWIDRGARLAWEHRDRLPHADSVIFNAEWHRNHVSDDWLGERGSFELYREAVRQYPERWDAWLLYADYLWHEGGFHVDDGRSMAVAGFNRALALDSLGHSEPWQHLQEHYLMTRDAESYARLPEQHRSSYSDYVLAMQADTGLDAAVWAQFEGERIPYHIRGYRDAIARGQGREANAHLDSIFSQEAYQYVNHAVFDLQASGAGYEMADRLVGFLEERATAGDPNAATIAGIYWLNRGRPHRATPLLRIASQPPRLCGGRLCFLPVLWMQVGAFSGADPDEVGRIRDSLRVAHAVLDTVSYADLGPGEQAAFRHLLHERFWAVILDHVQGRTEDLEITARIALSAAEVVGDPRKQHEPGLISAFLDAVVLANADDPGALGAVQAADSALGMRMTLRSQMAWILILAQLYDRAGDAEKALAVIRRQGMVFGEEYVHLLPARLLQRARLAAELGLTDEATQAYNHYLTLRSDPEPVIEKQVAAVRAELAAVVGEHR